MHKGSFGLKGFESQHVAHRAGVGNSENGTTATSRVPQQVYYVQIF